MSCNNCFNNCTDIKPDKCIRYTGADISALEIQNGDTLLSVEQKLITYLLSALDGTGIEPAIEPSDLCDLVTGYLGAGTNLVDIVTALIKSICDLQTQVTDVTSDMTTLNADYDVDCLDVVTNSSDTHEVLQAVIDKLCTVVTDLQALSTDLSTNYVALSDLNDLIQTYLDSTSSSLMKNKMVPYTAVEYYGPLTNFDLTGAGTGDWVEIYLCNGNNGTPDKRGRVAVGTTTGMGGGAFDAAVDPNIAGNPDYELYDTEGANTITLSEAEMPQHTHTTNVDVTDGGHTHFEFNNDSTTNGTPITNATYPVYNENRSNNYSYTVVGTNTEPTLGISSEETTGISVDVTNENAGSSEAHSNIQPVLACHYIIYLPS